MKALLYVIGWFERAEEAVHMVLIANERSENKKERYPRLRSVGLLGIPVVREALSLFEHKTSRESFAEYTKKI